MTWDVRRDNGLWLPQTGWRLDAPRAAARSFVSHAHGDHIAAHRETICTPATARLLQARLPSARGQFHLLACGQTEPLTPDCALTLHPAGHILGSAQCLLEHAEHGRLLYTGDFRFVADADGAADGAETCATPRADVLIMETTFGRPRYVFPPRAAVLADLARFCRETLAGGGTPLLFAYSLGKSQALLAGLADAGLPFMLHRETARLTRLHEELGAVFPRWREFHAPEAAGHVVICPPQADGIRQCLPRPRSAAVTGWALDPGATYRHRCDAAFPLSDHADFPGLLAFVERVQPRRVLTVHGFAREFAATLRARGIEAWALGRENQLELAFPGAPA